MPGVARVATVLRLVLLVARDRVRAAEEQVALLMRQFDAEEATRREAGGRRLLGAVGAVRAQGRPP